MIAYAKVYVELPPRARRIQTHHVECVLEAGTTSACAENTQHVQHLPHDLRNYLRVRGEYGPASTRVDARPELPPRARRIQFYPCREFFVDGTTSACAENTFETFDDWGDKGNYLRVRGEYEVAAGGPSTHLGTTSACAENTACVMPLTNSQGNYLRVRGEYPTPRPEPLSAWELPPRARRIHKINHDHDSSRGTTSACAENTQVLRRPPHDSWNYLRVRGEYDRKKTMVTATMELPPRARRILHAALSQGKHSGTTSACAENTMRLRMIWGMVWNYLRVRGEYGWLSSVGSVGLELPPRARRILAEMLIENAMAGTTSACAENTPAFPQGKQLSWNYLRVRGEY